MKPSPQDAKTDKSPEKNSPKKVVVLPHEVHGQVKKAAKKFKLTNSEFASAALSYFTETGLDPRTMSKASLARIENRVVQETYDVREHNANIGNRLVGVIRTFERNMGTMIQQQQAGTFKYLEGIERNILTYLVNIEESLFSTILERVLSNGIESNMSRIILQTISLQLKNKPFTPESLKEITLNYDRQRDEELVVKGQKLVESKRVERPKVSLKPAIVELPKPPAKPTAGGTVPTPTTATANTTLK
jgi:hypothetical protein